MLKIRVRQGHPGHGPGFVSDALWEAIEDRGVKHWREGLRIEFNSEKDQQKWEAATTEERALWVLRHLLGCGDIIGSSHYSTMADELEFHGLHTVAAVARWLLKCESWSSDLVDKKRASA